MNASSSTVGDRITRLLDLRLTRRRLLRWLPIGLGCACCSENSVPVESQIEEANEEKGENELEGDNELEADNELEQARQKILDFDRVYADDVFVAQSELRLLDQVTSHLMRSRDFIGFGRFNTIGFDELLRLSAKYSEIGEFDRVEVKFIEQVFYETAQRYGFYGERVSQELTEYPKQKDLRRVGAGHFLFAGASFDLYQRLAKDLDGALILTSGVRGNVKQLQLFLEKVSQAEGNLSRASRSVAPPGYSYHSRGDFDVGRPGVGYLDFTEAFAQTSEFSEMADLGYIEPRYSSSNPFGVRYEPWHVKVG